MSEGGEIFSFRSRCIGVGRAILPLKKGSTEGRTGMIRGTKRQVIVMETRKSRYFDAVYFVLRAHACGRDGGRELIAEARRLAAEASEPTLTRMSERRAFLRGVLCGGCIATLSAALFVVLFLLCGGIF